MVHVPYRGSALAFPDIMSNKVQLIFGNLPSPLEQARAGNARARRHLAATLARRARYPRCCRNRAGIRSGRILRHGRAQGHAAVAILNQAVGEALKDPKLAARLTEFGGIPKPMMPAEFGRLVADEAEKWRKAIEFAGVSVE